MKKILVVICFLNISNLIAQDSVSLTLRDGTIISGTGKINMYDRIVFRKNRKDKKTMYDYKTVKRVKVIIGDSEKNYEYKVIKGLTSDNIKLMESIDIGEVILYAKQLNGTSSIPMGPSGSGITMHQSSTLTLYFISRKGEDIVTSLNTGNTYSKKFRNIAEFYFEDCPKLLNKIKSKHFNRYGIESIVSYYNNYCKN